MENRNISKGMFQYLFQFRNNCAIIFRLFNVYGSTEGRFIRDLINNVINNETLILK